MRVTSNQGIAGLTVPLVFFFVVYKIVSYIAVPAHIRSKGKEDVWKWKNLVVSLIHSLTASIGCIISVYDTPNLLVDRITEFTLLGYFVIIFSSGYFIYDLLDLIVHGKALKLWEISVHHVVVFSTFLYNVVSQTCLGYTIFALLVEINSVFLHSRKLILLMRVPGTSWLYRSLSVVNLVTFVLLRGYVVPVLIYSVGTLGPSFFPAWYFYYFCVSLFFMLVMNIVLFYLLVKSDYYLWTGATSASSSDKLVA